MPSTPGEQRAGPPVSTTTSRQISTTVTTRSGLTKKFVFASEWFFHPEGIKSLTEEFNRELALKNLEAIVVWNRDNATFCLSCLHATSERVWEIFFKTVRDLIIQESGDSLDDSSDDGSEIEESDGDEARPTKNHKIQILSAWKKQYGATVNVNEIEVEGFNQPVLQLVDEWPEPIRPYTSKLTWNYNANNPSLEEIAPDELLVKLEDLTQCKFFKDLNLSKIYIGAFSEDESHRAVCKLDTIQKAWTMRYAYMKHLFYTEDIEDYHVVFKYIADVKKRFFETTLLDNLQLSASRFDYHNVHRAVTVRCFVFNAMRSSYTPLKVSKSHAAVPLDKKDSGCRDWNNFAYAHYIPTGKEDQNAMSHFESHSGRHQKSFQCTTPQQSEQISVRSQEASQPEIPSGPQQSLIHTQETQLWVEGQDKPSSSSDPSLQGRSEDDTSDNHETRPGWDNYEPLPEQSRDKPKTRFQSAQIFTKASATTHRASVCSIQAPQTPSSKRHPTLNLPQASINMAGKPLSSKSGTLYSTPRTDAATSINLLDKDNSILGVPVLQPIQRAGFSSSPTNSFVESLGGSPAQQLENMRSVKKVLTDTFHTTMNQEASMPVQKAKTKGSRTYSFAGRLEPPPPPPIPMQPQNAAPTPVDPIPAFIETVAVSFDELLQGLRAFQGGLTVEAEFGRILLKNVLRRQISREDSESSLEPDDALRYLENPTAPPTVVFTKVLTILPADISYLVEMKDQQGNFIWKQEQQPWEVFYEILCVDCRAGCKPRPFTIEIDEETFTSTAKIRRDFGAINVHGVKRRWDFRISATGVEADENTDPTYKAFAKAVKDSLHIPKGLSMPMLFFEVPHCFQDFAVFGVRVRRVARYKSLHGNSMLNVSEVRELQMFDTEGEVCTIWKAVGCPEPDTLLSLGYKMFYIWHEVSISCPEADAMFEQDKDIELGEEASWDTKKLSEIHTIQALYLPACEMLKRMDGIGFYNDNGMDARAVQSAYEVEKQPAEYYFW